MELQLGRTYSRRQISEALGGNARASLPTNRGRVVCGCFKKQPRWNPGAPEEVVFGPGPKVEQAADLVFRQRDAIPVFLFRGASAWEYVGNYRCIGLDSDPRTCRRKEAENPARGEIRGVLRFRRVRP